MTWARPPARVKQWDGPRPTPRALLITSQCVGDDTVTETILVLPIPKEAPVRSESYRRFVAQQPCFGCGIEGFSQAAHPNQGKGMALKACDLKCFPLCAPHFGLIGCHQQHDLRMGVGRDESREIEAAYTQRMQRIAKAAGRTEFNEEAA